ncbi:MAG TPA: class I SAM-dependent methyltransferase [Pirellulales bacterium]|nr:class I SAM-dependent methyltransferase [Pirellulales bacterium]
MKPLDRLLQSWRIAKILPFLNSGARVLDIGCADGALLRQAPALGEYVGVDPAIERTRHSDGGTLIKGTFPDDLPDGRAFDAITMLAVLEHIPAEAQGSLADACGRFLRPGGLALITVPSPWVDWVLAVLKFLRVIDGMSLEEHYGFDVRQVRAHFAAPAFQLVAHRRFQLGLNHLFVFRRA